MKPRAVVLCYIISLIACMTGNSGANASVRQYPRPIPLAFTENQGQADDSARFTAHMPNGGISFSPSGITFLLSGETDASRARRAAKRSVVFENASNAPEPVEREYHTVHIRFEGANETPAISGETRLPWNANYFRGNDPSQWKTDVPNYAEVRYHDLYPGIDMVYAGGENTLKYDFIVSPGSDPSRIRLTYEGATGIRVNAAGDLEVDTPAGRVIEKKPYCYQVINGKEIEVSARYAILERASCAYGFETGRYDPAYPLIIDPELVFSTLLGGVRYDSCIGVAVDKQGHIYLAGGTQSPDFPSTPDSYDSTYGGFDDIYITKFDPSGGTILYSTFIGGGSRDKYPFGMDVDEYGNVVIAGVTPENAFPKTPGSYTSPDQSFLHSENRIFVAKLNSAGNKLIFSAVFGRPHQFRWENLHMKLDQDGNIYGACLGLISTTPNALQQSPPDVEKTLSPFIFKLSADGGELLYSSYFDYGDKDSVRIRCLDVDREGNIYLAGDIGGNPENINFPVTEECLDSQFHHFPDSSPYPVNGFISKISPQDGLLYSSFLFHTYPRAIYVASSGAMYFVSSKQGRFFPITENAYNKEGYNNSRLLYKISPSGRELIFSTYLFNAGIYGLEVDSGGDIYFAGVAFETSPIPVTPDAYDSTFNGGAHDIFLCKMDPLGTKLLYSTYLGGSGREVFNGLALDNSGNVYLAGSARSSDFPTTEGAWGRTFKGEVDVWLCKFSFSPGPVKVEDAPRAFTLAPAYPNPFNPSTTISFSLPAPGHATLAVYDIAGRKVRTLVSGPMTAGEHAVAWDGRDDGGKPVASGVYLTRLVAGERVATGRMALVR